MSDKTELTLSINQANSLKRITKMPGWKIIENFLAESEEECDGDLKDDNNDDLVNIKADRKVLKWIKKFRDLLKDTEISAYNDEQELKIIKGNNEK